MRDALISVGGASGIAWPLVAFTDLGVLRSSTFEPIGPFFWYLAACALLYTGSVSTPQALLPCQRFDTYTGRHISSGVLMCGVLRCTQGAPPHVSSRSRALALALLLP